MRLHPLLAPPLLLTLLLAMGLLQGCAASSDSMPASVEGEGAAPEPELNLNLPDAASTECQPAPQRDFTFLDKGLLALADGDHIEAVTYFQRYQRLESSTEADWEAGIAIAYDSMLSQSPFYDPIAALSSYEVLRDTAVDEPQVHAKILLMRDALATFADLQSQIGELREDNARLSSELAKREDALKRLRELTLGQKATAP